MDIKAVLSGKDAGYLADLVIKLLNNLDETQRLDFIGKYIDAGLALECYAKDDKGLLNGDDILSQVEDFCMECLDGAYFVDAEYDDYYDSYNEEEFEESDWAVAFANYLRLAVMYARNGDDPTAYDIFTRIFDCLHNCEYDYEMLGTENPIDYINVDMSDAFDVFFKVILKVKESNFKAYDKIFSVWSDFEYYCTPLLVNSLVDLKTATDVVVSKIKNDSNFSSGEKLFLMLEKLFIQNNEPFNKLEVSKKLLNHHDNFSYYVACGYYEQNLWENAINTAKNYMEKVTGDVGVKLKAVLTDAYEENDQPEKAYENSLSMFYGQASYQLYKRTRLLAAKVTSTESFFELAEDYLIKSEQYSAKTIYREILSFEGKIKELIIFSENETNNYNLLKYAAKSLVYRALKDKPDLSSNLCEYINQIIVLKPDGIIDMLPCKDDDKNMSYILLAAIGILKKQVQFHIDAAKRSRYAKAAYYCGVAADIYDLLGQDSDRKAYILLLMDQNRRRPAFKDEMNRKFGKS